MTRGNFYDGDQGRNREKVSALYQPNAKNPPAERDNAVEGSERGGTMRKSHGNDNEERLGSSLTEEVLKIHSTSGAEAASCLFEGEIGVRIPRRMKVFEGEIRHSC